MNEFTFASDFNMPIEEAKKFVSDFKTALPTLFRWVDATLYEARRTGVVYTMFGRPRRVKYWLESPDFKKKAFGERTVINTKIQGTGADILKISFINIYNTFFRNTLQNRKYIKFLNTVHDEINYNVSKEKIHEIVPKLISCMRIQLDTKQQPELSWPL